MSKKKALIIFFILLAVIMIFPNNKSDVVKLVGNYIKLEVYNENASFIIYGRNNIESKWIPLLFEDYPPTSYFRFYKGEKRIPFGEGGRGRYSEIEIKDNSIKYFWQDDEIKIEINYSLVSSKQGGNADTLLIDMVILNRKYYEYTIEFFSCFDTYLGEKENKHFNLEDGTVLTREKQLYDISDVSYIKSFNKENNIGVNIILNKEKQVVPDRIFFANWKKVDKTIGLYSALDGRSFDLKPYSTDDSAVFIEYINQKLIPEVKKKYRFIISMENNVELFANKSNDNKDDKDNISNNDNADANKDDNKTENIEKDNSDKNNINNKNDNEKSNDKINMDKDLKKLDLINLSLADLLKLLDYINNKLENGQKLTNKDVEFAEKILSEIKKRRGY